MQINGYMDEMVLVHVRWTCVFSIVAVSAITYRIPNTCISWRVPYNWTFSLTQKSPSTIGGSIFKRTLSHFVSERALTQHSHYLL